MVTVPKGYFRFSGWLLLLGGLMGAIGQVVHLGDTPESVADIPSFLQTAVSTHVLLAWASTLILLGLPGLFLRQASSLRLWGWIALPLLFIALLFEIFHGPVQILAYPIIFSGITTEEALAPVNDMVNNLMIDDYPIALAVLVPLVPFLFIGLLLAGIAFWKARVLPKAVVYIWLGDFAIQIISMFVKLPFQDHLFSLVHVGILATGVALAFEKQDTPASHNNPLPAAKA